MKQLPLETVPALVPGSQADPPSVPVPGSRAGPPRVSMAPPVHVLVAVPSSRAGLLLASVPVLVAVPVDVPDSQGEPLSAPVPVLVPVPGCQDGVLYPRPRSHQQHSACVAQVRLDRLCRMTCACGRWLPCICPVLGASMLWGGLAALQAAAAAAAAAALAAVAAVMLGA